MDPVVVSLASQPQQLAEELFLARLQQHLRQVQDYSVLQQTQWHLYQLLVHLPHQYYLLEVLRILLQPNHLCSALSRPQLLQVYSEIHLEYRQQVWVSACLDFLDNLPSQRRLDSRLALFLARLSSHSHSSVLNNLFLVKWFRVSLRVNSSHFWRQQVGQHPFASYLVPNLHSHYLTLSTKRQWGHFQGKNKHTRLRCKSKRP